MKKFLIGLGILALASIGYAQTGVNATAFWFQPGNTQVDAQGFIYTLTIDSGSPITLIQTCTTVNNQVQCTAPVNNWDNTVNHNLLLKVSDSVGNTAQATFTTKPGPTTPTGGKIIVIIIGDNE